MTWLNILDSEKTQKKINIDIIKFSYDGPAYTVSNANGGTHAFDKGYCPLLLPNKTVICGTDFLTLSTAVSNGVTVQAFNLPNFDHANYIYLIDYSFGYFGHSANELNGYYVNLVRSSTLLNCFNVGAFPSTIRTVGFYNSTTGPIRSTNFFVSSGTTNYTADLSNAESTRGNLIIHEGVAAYALTGFGAIVVRPVLSSTTSLNPTGHKIANVEMIIKRIAKV